MTKIPTKCVFYDYGFCKYREKCRNQHIKTICEVINCDQKCMNRHPRECRYRKRCKFLEKNNCEYSHSFIVSDTEKLGDTNKNNEIANLLNKFQEDFDIKLNQNAEFIKVKESCIETNKFAKQNKKENDQLEEDFKKEIRNLETRICEQNCQIENLKVKLKEF